MNHQHFLLATKGAGTRTCRTSQSDRAFSLSDASHLLSEQYSNKCKTQEGLFGIISKEIIIPFPWHLVELHTNWIIFQ